MAHGMPIGQSTRIVVTDEIQARRNIVVRKAGLGIRSEPSQYDSFFTYFEFQRENFKKISKKNTASQSITSEEFPTNSDYSMLGFSEK